MRPTGLRRSIDTGSSVSSVRNCADLRAGIDKVGTIGVEELVSFAGHGGRQIADLSDGASVEIEWENRAQ